MKPVTLVYYERDPLPARALAASLRTGINLVMVREAKHNITFEQEVCSQIWVMPDVTAECRREIHRLYPGKVAYAQEPAVQQPVPPMPETDVEPEVKKAHKGRRRVTS